MRFKLCWLVLLLALIFHSSIYAQSKMDSIWSVWQDDSNHDTTRLIALGRFSWDGFLFTDPDSAFALAQMQYDFASEKSQKKFMAKALNTQGVAFYFQGDYENAIKTYQKSHEIFLEINLKGGAASTMNNIGLIYQEQGDYDKALDFTLKSKRLYEEMGSNQGIGSSLNNLGLIYENQGAYKKAIESYSQSIRIQEKLENSKGIINGNINIGNIYKSQADFDNAFKYYNKCLVLLENEEDFYTKATLLGNIGLTYLEMGDYDKALENFESALSLHTSLNNKQGMANIYINIALLYQDKKEFKIALDYYEKCLPIFEENEDREGVAIVLNSTGSIYYEQGEKIKALANCAKSLKIAQEIGATEQIRNSSKTLWEIYKNNGNYQKSLEMFEIFISSRDSIVSKENKKELFKQEVMMEHEKQIVADSIRNEAEKETKDAQIAQEKAENEKQRLLSYLLIGGLVLMLLVAFFIFSRLKVTRNQKRIIEIQKNKVDLAYDQLEMKNNEIMDSITYAKRIQSAILPSDTYFSEHFPESFVLYKPKDIVAGDFYWLRVEDEQKLLAVADCTGHGVPGAMVSVICNYGLSQSIKEYKLKDPGKILDKTRELVIEEFDKSDDDVQDGMDIALVSLEQQHTARETVAHNSCSILKYAGAHNPIWIIRKDSNELEEIKATKQPIGKYTKSEPFQTHEIMLSEGDRIYLSSDGFADQFGGEKGKKLKTKNFKDLLLSTSYLSIEDQGKRLEEFFDVWGKDHEQIDDVCVIGIRL